MIRLNLYKNKRANHANQGKIYGRAESNKMIGIKELAEHIAEHGTLYTKDVIQGVLGKIASCIKELTLGGTPVKIDDLCIFRASVIASPADDVESFDLNIDKTGENGNIKGVRLQCTPTGACAKANYTASAQLGYSSLAQKVKMGEIQLSDLKGEYVASSSAGGWGDEPLNP